MNKDLAGGVATNVISVVLWRCWKVAHVKEAKGGLLCILKYSQCCERIMQRQLLSFGNESGQTAADKVCVGTVLFVLDLLRLYCEEAHSEVLLMDPLESADKLKPATLSLCAFIKTLRRMNEAKRSARIKSQGKLFKKRKVTGEALCVKV